MSNFRLNARKPQRNNAGLGTPKGEIFLLYREDIVSMPDIDKRGVLTSGDIMIKAGRRFHILYTTPTSQVHYRETEGDVDSRGWKKKITGHYPGDELEINEFVKNNLNQGFIAIIKSCDSEFMRIYGSVNNPLYFTGSFTDDNDKKGYELTFEQNFADENPVLFYQGKIIVDEDITSSGVEYNDLYVRLDGSNISEQHKIFLKDILEIGNLPENIATIDSENQINNGNVYTKEQIEEKLRTKVAFPTRYATPAGSLLGLAGQQFLVGYEEELNTVPGQNEPHYNVVRYSLEDIGKNLANSNLKIPQGQIRELDVTGAKLRIKGLEDKSADASFNKMKVQNELGEEAVSSGKPVIESLMQGLPSNKLSNNSYDPAYAEYLVFNPATGKIAKSDKPQIITNFTVPNSITINHNTNVANVNWLPNPSYPQDLTDTLDFVKSIDSIGFTPVLANEFVVRKLPNSKFPSSASSFVIPDFEFRNGEMLYNGNAVQVPAGFRDLDYQANNEENNALINIFINKELPVDKDWVLRFRLFGSDLLGGVNSFFGFRESVNLEPNHDLINDVVFTRFGSGGFRSSFDYRNNSRLIAKDFLDFKNNDFYMIKKGNIVTLFTRSYHDGILQMGAMGYINTMKYMVFGLNLNAIIFSKFYMKDVSYWIKN
ncbi:hypothetical protein [Bergeyella zoohelcum]|nr:hypothetical protein [Bergeyella zoohelcum]